MGRISLEGEMKKAIRWNELNGAVQILGVLGRPLGTMVEIGP